MRVRLRVVCFLLIWIALVWCIATVLSLQRRMDDVHDRLRPRHIIYD